VDVADEASVNALIRASPSAGDVWTCSSQCGTNITQRPRFDPRRLAQVLDTNLTSAFLATAPPTPS